MYVQTELILLIVLQSILHLLYLRVLTRCLLVDCVIIIGPRHRFVSECGNPIDLSRSISNR